MSVRVFPISLEGAVTTLQKKTLTPAYSFVQGTFWMSFCASVCFAAVHMQFLGFSNTELGLVMAAGNVLGALIGPALTTLSERNARLGTARLNTPLFLARALCLLGLLFLPGHSLFTAVVYAVFLAVVTAVNSLNLKFCVDAEQRELPLDYGVARGIGSLAFVLASAGLGVLLGRLSAAVLPYVGIVLLLLQIAANAAMARALGKNAPAAAAEAAEQEQATSILRFFRQEPRYTVFLLGSVLVFFAHTTGTYFMINLIENVGGTAESMGYLNAFMAVVEIPVMLLFSRLLRGKRVSALLAISVAAFLLKGLAISLAPSLALLFAAHCLQAPSFALYTCAVVPYTSTVIAPRDAAKAQSLAFSVTTMGAVLASPISGRLFDVYSVRTTMLIATAVCAVGVVISLAGIKKTEPVLK